MSHIGWGGEQKITVEKPSLTALRVSLKGKTQRGQYQLAVDLGCYKCYQSQTPDDVPAFSLFPEGGRHEVC